MNVFEAALVTYDVNSAIVGAQLDSEGYVPLPPVSHLVTKAKFEIVLNEEGALVNARAVDITEPKIIIPVSEQSASRTSNNAAHALSEQIAYLSGEDEPKYNLYCKQLKEWAESDPGEVFLKAVLTYVEGRTILADLNERGLLTLDDDGAHKNGKDTVRWVLQTAEGNRNCWLDRDLFQSWIRFYAQKQKNMGFCMVTGKMAPIVKIHPRCIVPTQVKAKLISSADKYGFSWRGRFEDSEQAVSVSYEASQKIHNVLRWLVENNGTRAAGTRTFVCWDPFSAQIFSLDQPIYQMEEAVQEPISYRNELYKLIYNAQQTVIQENHNIVIVVFDAATSGRLAVTYFREIQGSDFVSRMYNWDSSCAWYNSRFGIQTPSLKRIIHNAFGIQVSKNGKPIMEAKQEVVDKQLQRLIACRLGQAKIPVDIERNLVSRASCPTRYDEYVWENILFTACAMIACRIYSETGEVVIATNLDMKDRSFQLGRLLAVLDRAEMDWYRITKDYRQTTAKKNMQHFQYRPMDTYARVSKWLETAYIPRLPGYSVKRYRTLKAEIMENLSSFTAEELNRPLSSMYLVGYDLQQRAFFNKSGDENTDTCEQF